MAKTILINKYQIVFVVIALIFTFNLGIWALAYGEQSGGSPESGSTSHISSLYTALQSSGFGSDADTPDWGATWNRIKTSAQWTPNGNVTPSDVMNGKTFFNSSRTQQTGTMLVAGSSCPTQEYHDGYGAPVTQETNCSSSSDWIVPSGGINGTEKQDKRSGLIWSNSLINYYGTLTFSPDGSANWSWDESGVSNIAVGNLTAITLCSSMGDGWRLPTQKELMQAYIDGANFNLSRPGDYYWSATSKTSTSKWMVNLSNGYTDGSYYQNNGQVRCVR